MIRFALIFIALFAASCSAFTEVVECSACVLNREGWLAASSDFENAVRYNVPDCPISDWTATLAQESPENVWSTLTQQYLITLANYNSALTNDAYCKETLDDFIVNHELRAKYERARAIIETHCGDIPLTQQEARDDAQNIADALQRFNAGADALPSCAALAQIEPETGNVPIEQSYDTASQAGITAGIVLAFVVLLGLLWLVQTRMINSKRD